MAKRGATIIRVVCVLLVALVISAACRTFCVELYTVAPQQMENTLLAGDRVLVEKWHYGALQEVKRNDIVVYNYPIDKPIPLSQCPTAMARCIGIPGDVVEAREGALYINGTPSAQSPVATAAYMVSDSIMPQVTNALKQMGETSPLLQKIAENNHLLYLDRYQYNKLCGLLSPSLQPTPVLLAHDNYKIELPRYDQKVAITPDNAAFYADIINRYEPAKVQLHGNALYRGGRKITSYRFTHPYYWVVCDNRTAATDSRTFGVLPHSHLIGRCGIILFSIDAHKSLFSSWRLQRFFKSVSL